MPVSIGVIEGTLRLNNLLTPELDKAGKSLLASGKKIQAIGDQMSQVGTKLTVGITLPIVAIAGAATKFATSFESSFTGVRKTINATKDQFAELSDELRRLAKDEIPLTVDGLNRIAETGGQLGIATENITSFTETIAAIGVSTVLSTEQAAVGFARLANITGLPQTKFENLGSSIVELGNNLATMEDEILDFSLRIAGAGTIAGITEPQILGIAAAFASVGVQSQAGGTATQKVILSMVDAVAQASPKLTIFAQTAGMTAEQFAKAFKDDAASAFASFVEGIGNQGEKAFGTLESLELADQRLIRAFLALGNAGDLLSRSINISTKAFDENKALAEEAAKRYATFESQLTLFLNKAKDVGITLGTALIPVFKDMLDILSPLIDKLGGVAELFSKLPGPIKAAAVALVGLLAAAGPVLFIAGQLLSAWGAFSAFIPTLTAAISSVVSVLAGPVGWAVAIGVLIASIKPLRDLVVNFANLALKGLRIQVEAVTKVLNFLWNSTKGVRRILSATASVLKDRFVKSLEIAWSWIKNVATVVRVAFDVFVPWQVVVESTAAALQLVGIILRDQVVAMVELVTNHINRLVGAFKSVVIVMSVLNPTVAVLASEMDKLIDEVKEELAAEELRTEALIEAEKWQQAMTDAIKDNLPEVEKQTKAVTVSRDIIKSYGSQAEDLIVVLTDLSGGFTDNTDDIEDNRDAYNLLKKTFDVVGLSGMDLVDLTRDLSAALEKGVISSDQFEAAMERVENRTETTSTRFSNFGFIISDVFNLILTQGKSFSDAISKVFNSMVSSFVDSFTSVLGAGLDAGKGFTESLKSAWAQAKEHLLGTFQGIVAGIGAMSGNMEDLMTGAMSAIVNFAQGNMIAGIASAVGVAIGLFKKLFGSSKRKIEEVSDSFIALSNDISGSSTAIRNMSKAITEFKELVRRDIGEARKVFEQQIGGIVDSVLSSIDELSTGVSSMFDVVAGTNFITGLVRQAMFGNLGAREIEQQLSRVRDKFFDVLGEMNQFLVDQSVAILDGLTQAFGDFATSSAEDITFAEESILQAFAAMSTAGMSVIEIADSLGEMLVSVGNRGIELGITFSDEFSRMGEMMAILARDEVQELIIGFDGVAQSVQAIGNIGLLTAEQVDFFGDSARKVYNQLIAQGLTTAEAIASMGPQWQILNDLQEMYGFALDASTQGLLDQAIAQGVVTQAGLTSNDIMIEGFNRMLEALNELIRVLGGIPIMFEDIGRAANEAGEIIGDMPRPPGPPGGGGPGGPDRGPRGDGFTHGSNQFMDFGPQGTVTRLHDVEQVVTAREGTDLLSMVAGLVNKGGSSDLGNDDEIKTILKSGFEGIILQQQMMQIAVEQKNNDIKLMGTQARLTPNLN